MSRAEIQQAFVESFATGNREPFTAEDIAAIESDLGVVFPASYLEFVSRYGAIRTPGLLDLVTGGEAEIPPEGASFDINDFLPAAEIIGTTRAYWEGGMKEDLVAIAMDSGGNVFGFRREVHDVRPDDSPVHVFDHDYVTISEESPGFDVWLESFLRMKALP